MCTLLESGSAQVWSLFTLPLGVECHFVALRCVVNSRSSCARILRTLVGLASSACLAHKAVRKCCEGDCKVIAALWWGCAASRRASDHWAVPLSSVRHQSFDFELLLGLFHAFRRCPLCWPHLRIIFRFTTEATFCCVWRVIRSILLLFLVLD